MRGADRDRTVDEATLRYLARLFGTLPEVDSTSLFPTTNAESLEVVLDATYYPETFSDVRVEIRAYTDGAFHVSYIETYLGERRRCRWDRHEQPHNARDHFHPLPDAETTDADDREYPPDLTELLREDVLPWIENRLGRVWEEDS